MSAIVLCVCRTRPVFLRSPAVLGGCGLPCLMALTGWSRWISVSADECLRRLPGAVVGVDCFFTMSTCMSSLVSALARGVYTTFVLSKVCLSTVRGLCSLCCSCGGCEEAPWALAAHLWSRRHMAGFACCRR